LQSSSDDIYGDLVNDELCHRLSRLLDPLNSVNQSKFFSLVVTVYSFGIDL